jgi:hypothetical protein
MVTTAWGLGVVADRAVWGAKRSRRGGAWFFGRENCRPQCASEAAWTLRVTLASEVWTKTLTRLGTINLTYIGRSWYLGSKVCPAGCFDDSSGKRRKHQRRFLVQPLGGRAARSLRRFSRLDLGSRGQPISRPGV